MLRRSVCPARIHEVIAEIFDITIYLDRDDSPLAAAVFDADFNPRNDSFYFTGTEPSELSISGYQALVYFNSDRITPDGILTLLRTDGTEERIDLRPYTAILVQYGEQNEKNILSGELQDYEIGNCRLHFDHIAISRAEDGSVVWDSASGFVLIR